MNKAVGVLHKDKASFICVALSSLPGNIADYSIIIDSKARFPMKNVFYWWIFWWETEARVLKYFFLRYVLLLFSGPLVSDSLWPYGLQHTRLPCPSPSPKVCPSSCPLHQWCHPAISSSDDLFSLCPQSFPPSGTFPMSQLFESVYLNTDASASSSSVLPNEYSGLFSLKIG